MAANYTSINNWNTLNITQTNQTAGTTWYYNTFSSTSPSITQYVVPQQLDVRRVSSAEMIRLLELDGHKVLKRQRVARIHPADLRLEDFQCRPYDELIFEGYVLPEASGNYLMPDGSTLHVDQFGNYQVCDQNAKVTYKANRIREFNPYISASDLLEAFIKEVGQLDGINQGEILRLPIEAFINWLILQAAKKDGDSLDGLPSVEAALPRLPPPSKKPRCLGCGRFMQRAWAATRISFCSQEHWRRYERKYESRRVAASIGGRDDTHTDRIGAVDRAGLGSGQPRFAAHVSAAG